MTTNDGATFYTPDQVADFIQSILEKIPSVMSVRPSGDRFKFNCLFANTRHAKGIDRNPSMVAGLYEARITVYCHACGYKGDLDTALAQVMNGERDLATKKIYAGLITDIKKLLVHRFPDFSTLEKGRARRKQDADYTSVLMELLKFSWSKDAINLFKEKNVDPVFARKVFGCFFVPKGTQHDSFVTKDPLVSDCVGFPIIKRGKDGPMCVGAQVRPLHSSGSKYFTLLSFSVTHHIFGEHLLHKYEGAPLCAVEGPFDTMNLAYLKVPVAGLTGLSLSRERVELIKTLARPSCVLGLLDPDPAGEGRQAVFERTFRKSSILYFPVKLTSDPKYYTLAALRAEIPKLAEYLDTKVTTQ